MKKSRLRALIWVYWLALGACLFPGLSVAETAGAKAEYPLWEYPGRYPFKGSDHQAADRLLGDTSMVSGQFWTAVANHQTNECEEDYFLQDGMVVKTTFSVPSKTGLIHKAKWLRVAFKYPPGHKKAAQPLPKDHPDRWAELCASGNKDGYNVLWPRACGQPTIGVVSMSSPKPEVKTSGLECFGVPFDGGDVPVVENHFYLDGQPLNSCCCGGSLPISGLNLTIQSPKKIGGTGSAVECIPKTR